MYQFIKDLSFIMSLDINLCQVTPKLRHFGVRGINELSKRRNFEVRGINEGSFDKIHIINAKTKIQKYHLLIPLTLKTT